MKQIQPPSPAFMSVSHAELRASASSCARWIRAAAGGETATVRIAMPDASGRLRVAACEGEHDGSGRLRSTRRRAVFRTRKVAHLPIQGPAGLMLSIYPLANDGDCSLGVVEVLAPTEKLTEREDVLLALIGQSALVLSSAQVRAHAERALAGMSALVRLAAGLLGAGSAVDAVRVTADVCAGHLGTLVAGLLPDRDGWGWFLAASEGLGTRKRSELRMALRTADQDPMPRRVAIPTLRRRFREVTGTSEVIAVRAGKAVLLLGDAPLGHDEFLDRVGALLAAALTHLGVDRLGHARRPVSELGIAWTAHELKAPLVGARAALERAYETGEASEGRELLRRTKEELRQMADLIDPLLRWSTGAETLKRERTDLVRVVRDAVNSSVLEWDVDRVVIEAPDHVFVRADAGQLRGAIANVLRNALVYSPHHSPVRVRVEGENRWARVVIRDSGPGVPADERDVVFDPFARGRVGSLTRRGAGLGLFIARRVLEAHSGTISLRLSKPGATFVLELPLPDEGRERSAS